MNSTFTLVKAHAALPVTARQTLMIDADDTLWENNIFFDRAISRFIGLVDHPHLSPSQVRERFSSTEHARVKIHGYGAASFRDSMLACFQDLTGSPCTPAQADAIHGFAQAVLHHEIELLPGVAETLPALAARHRLLLVTKGHAGEQTSKFLRSGLGDFFSGVEVLPEKHEEAYRALHDLHGCEHGSTWMIGNSPKSDINPALAAGLHAVYVPHSSTWVLEHEALTEAPRGQHLLQLPGFRSLLHVFGMSE